MSGPSENNNWKIRSSINYLFSSVVGDARLICHSVSLLCYVLISHKIIIDVSQINFYNSPFSNAEKHIRKIIVYMTICFCALKVAGVRSWETLMCAILTNIWVYVLLVIRQIWRESSVEALMMRDLYTFKSIGSYIVAALIMDVVDRWIRRIYIAKFMAYVVALTGRGKPWNPSVRLVWVWKFSGISQIRGYGTGSASGFCNLLFYLKIRVWVSKGTLVNIYQTTQSHVQEVSYVKKCSELSEIYQINWDEMFQVQRKICKLYSLKEFSVIIWHQ